MVTGDTRFGCWIFGVAAHRLARACASGCLFRGTSAQHVLLSRDGAARRASRGRDRARVVSRVQALTARVVVVRPEEFHLAQRRRALLAHDGRHLGLVIFTFADL